MMVSGFPPGWFMQDHTNFSQAGRLVYSCQNAQMISPSGVQCVTAEYRRELAADPRPPLQTARSKLSPSSACACPITGKKRSKTKRTCRQRKSMTLRPTRAIRLRRDQRRVVAAPSSGKRAQAGLRMILTFQGRLLHICTTLRRRWGCRSLILNVLSFFFVLLFL
jgi:hypothetical protein